MSWALKGQIFYNRAPLKDGKSNCQLHRTSRAKSSASLVRFAIIKG